ncbi:hypothetical protein VPH35_117237 [Triticum aestivum]
MEQPWPPAAAPPTTTSCSALSSPPRATAGRRRRTRGRRGSVRINASNPASAYGDTDVEALAATAALYAPTLLAEPCLSGSPSMYAVGDLQVQACCYHLQFAEESWVLTEGRKDVC